MGKEMDKTYWENAWDEARLRSPGRARPENEAKWASYWDEVADEYLRDVLAEESAYRSVIDYLLCRNVFRPWDRVLDIGCGPGTYSLLFAEGALTIDALDPSAAMLAAMAKEASLRDLTGIRPFRARWDDFLPRRQYDLVFSAMSPGVRDTKSLLKMEACSVRSCCLVTYGQAPGYGPRNDLWELVVGEPPSSNPFLYVYPYNVLREGGREPGLEMFDLKRTKTVPVEQLVRQYVTYFGIFTGVDARKERLIRDYFEARSEDGLFEAKTQVRQAVISWAAPRESAP
jgi:SAM-dependent methyltransferase